MRNGVEVFRQLGVKDIGVAPATASTWEAALATQAIAHLPFAEARAVLWPRCINRPSSNSANRQTNNGLAWRASAIRRKCRTIN